MIVHNSRPENNRVKSDANRIWNSADHCKTGGEKHESRTAMASKLVAATFR